MNTAPLKSYAPAARRAFIAAVTAQAARLGITAKEIAPATVQGDVLLVNGQPFPRSAESGRMSLIRRVKNQGFEATMDAVAYTWFNRLVAIRYMELHNYLDHGYRVLSDPGQSGRPEILDKAAEVELAGLDRAKVVQLKLDGTRDEELYRMLLIAQCNALHKAMPFLFEKIGDETELLLPANLLHTDSLIRQLVESIEESAWQQIEIIGWLYQFYISEKKDQVIGKVVKSEDIPAATQLFTPNWIVKYMVQNSLGAQWLATYPTSPLRAQMEYYIEPAEQTEEVKAQLAAITPASLNPEEITLIDPACGSGHILVEAYDLFKAIYVEHGYRERDAAQLILTKNLYGLDIDQRAAQLSGFALMMKGRADDRRLFERGMKLNVMAMVNSADLNIAELTHEMKLADFGLKESDLGELKNLFEHATTLGSLVQVPPGLVEKLPRLRHLCKGTSGDMFADIALESLRSLVNQGEMLAAKYDNIVANPPYMGSSWMSNIVKDFLAERFPLGCKDLFAAFIMRVLQWPKTAMSAVGLVTPFNWMYLTTFRSLREHLLNNSQLCSLVELETNAFQPAMVTVCTFTLRPAVVPSYKGSYVQLTKFKGWRNQAPKTLEALSDRACGWFFEANQKDFKKVPGSPIAYWVRDFKVFALKKLADFAESGGRTKTHNDERYVRMTWEVSRNSCGHGKTWTQYEKGGKFRKWSGERVFIVNWSPAARTFYESKGGLSNPKFWARRGITWSDITSSASSFRLKEPWSEYSSVSPTIFFDEASDEWFFLSLLNSQPVTWLLRILNPTLHVNPGDALCLPIVDPDESVGQRGRLCYEIAEADWNAYERSWLFQRHPMLSGSQVKPFPFVEASFVSWRAKSSVDVTRLQKLEEENNAHFINAYGLQRELTAEIPVEQITLTVNPAYRYPDTIKRRHTEAQREERFREDTIQELVSYAVGCMVGRYSLDEPGLIYAHSGNEGFDSSRYRKFPADGDGIIPVTDSAWFADDAATRLEEFLSVAWDKAHLEENLTFLADNLSPNKNEISRDTIRRYLCDKFFKGHLQTYKNRPIYWLFTSGKQKAFQCLVYLHRYNEGTLARMRSEYVIPLQGKMAARLAHLAEDRVSASAAQQKRIDKEATKLKKQHAELLEFDEKLRHYADRRISLDLDDGVKVNYGKFGSLLAEVTTVHGQKAEGP